MTELPPQDAFYSTLKGTHISDEDFAFCQRVWKQRNMLTFRDFLVWYNNLDVGPFITAVERLQAFYFEKNIDVLKIAISVPGIARRMIFKSARSEGAEFSIIDKRNKDLHDTIKANIIGGPSIIFTRYVFSPLSLISAFLSLYAKLYSVVLHRTLTYSNFSFYLTDIIKQKRPFSGEVNCVRKWSGTMPTRSTSGL